MKYEPKVSKDELDLLPEYYNEWGVGVGIVMNLIKDKGHAEDVIKWQQGEIAKFKKLMTRMYDGDSELTELCSVCGFPNG